MTRRALSIALLLLAITAAASTAYAGVAPGCCATNTSAERDAACGSCAISESTRDACCELQPAEAAPERTPSFDSTRLVRTLAEREHQLRSSSSHSMRRAFPSRSRALQAEPDPTIVLRI
jgi:hypothetical protein